MTENKKTAIQILNMFAENGFPTYNVEYMDGYFVFDMDKGNKPVYFDWSK